MEGLRDSYKSRVAAESPYNTGSAKVKIFQKAFQRPDGQPVFLKSPADIRLYRGIMGFSVVGIGLALFSIYRMATGQIKKKE